GSDLVRVIRQIAQVKRRIDDIDREIETLKGSDLFTLRADCETAREAGRDMLDELAVRVDSQIAEATQALADLRMHQYTGCERHEDGGKGDDPDAASGHGLSSDDHDDADVDADPTAGGQGVQCGDAATGTTGQRRSSGPLVMAGLPTSSVCEFVRIFPLQAHSPDLSCTVSCVKTRCDVS
ncbi:MAG: hypothetical protein MK134_12200, partial [Dehalococcoidia bacterium]|nr:hypothetical protein [Dehalococcoidia bacterium]